MRCFKPNLDVLNVIYLDDQDSEMTIYDDVSVLWAAAAVNRFSLVKILTEHGANVNHRTKTNSTPVRCACFCGNLEMVRYFIDHGADINIAKHGHQTNLSLSVYRKQLSVVNYLINDLGCDANECDDEGRSPLYFAVKCGSVEIIEVILKHGAFNFPAQSNNLSPLMLTADLINIECFQAIVSHCSLLEQIEGEELIGSSYTELGDHHLEDAFHHFCSALQLRLNHQLPKTVKDSSTEAFKNRQECQTLDQLEVIHSNGEYLRIEGLLVRERLLGSAHIRYHDSLNKYCNTLFDNDQFAETAAVAMYQLRLWQQHSMVIDSRDLYGFGEIYREMTLNSIPIPVHDMMIVVEIIFESVKSRKESLGQDFDPVLFFTILISQPSVDQQLSVNDRKRFRQLLRSINQKCYVTVDDEFSLLHLAFSNVFTTFTFYQNLQWKDARLHTVCQLLQCNADVNARDINGNTPLHIHLAQDDLFDVNIVKLLCDSGAHLDYANDLRQIPIDVTEDLHIKQFLKAQMKLSLKYICARLIRKSHISYHEFIPTSLQDFVEKH